MARPTEKDRVKRAFERIKAADTVYKRWDERYEPATLLDYYCGKQWRRFSPPDWDPLYKPYTANMVFATIETNQPTLLFYRPQCKIEPKPPFGDDPMSTVTQRAKLCQDTVQTFIDDEERIHFKRTTLLALRDANFRFGVIEVGYTADWIDNPHAGKPVLKEKSREDDPDQPVTDTGGDPVLHAERIAKAEQLFLKRIDPATFRVSMSSRNILDENDGCGYFEWHYVEDLKRNPKYKTSGLKPSGEAKDYPTAGSDEDKDLHKGMCKVWKWWDFRTQTRFVVADGHEKYLLDGESWNFLPFSVLKFHEIPNSFYPLPPVVNWVGPQDTINEVRESRRTHRRRFNRRYTHREGVWDPKELEKLEAGGDGVYAKHNGQPNEQPLMPVPDAPMGPDTDKDLVEAHADFQRVAGRVDEQAMEQSDTATQANIANVRTQIRESASRVEVADWLGNICRLILLTIRERMQLPFWIQHNADAISQDPQELLRVALTWEEITKGDLGTGALDVGVDVTSLSPVSEEQLAAQWNQLLALLTNPAAAMMLSMSPFMMKRTLKYYGVTSSGDVQEIQQVLQQMLMMQMAAQASAASAEGGAATPSGSQPGQPAGLPAAGGGVQ